MKIETHDEWTYDSDHTLPFQNHVMTYFCRNNVSCCRYFMNYFARNVQYPGSKNGVGIINVLPW